MSISILATPAGARRPVDAHCAGCATHQFCLPPGLDPADVTLLDKLIGQRRRVPAATFLYRAGQPLRSLYAIRCGHFKTCRPGAGGEQVTGFPMTGELLGIEAIGTGLHQSDAIALDDSVVCELPFAALERMFDEVPGLHRRFDRIMSAALNRDQDLMLMLGNMCAEQRLAVFLVKLGASYAARGYSAHQYYLRMAREDIASYLGLTIESISRLLARFRKTGLIAVDKRGVALLDPVRLAAMANGTERCSPLA